MELGFQPVQVEIIIRTQFSHMFVTCQLHRAQTPLSVGCPNLLHVFYSCSITTVPCHNFLSSITSPCPLSQILSPVTTSRPLSQLPVPVSTFWSCASNCDLNASVEQD